MSLSSHTRNRLGSNLGNTAGAELAEILDLIAGPGETWYVDSVNGSANFSGTSWANPLDTLDSVFDVCNANDTILLAPNHVETLSADSAVDIDVAGVRVIGLGRGESRPTFTFDTAATADFKLAAAGVRIENLLFKAGIDALTGPIEVSAADCEIVNCEYRDDDSNNYETVDVLVTTAAAHRLLVDGFKFIHDGGSGGTQIQSVINLAIVDGAEIRNCFIICDGALGCIECAAATQVDIHDNHLESTHPNNVCITLAGTTTGLVYRNFCKIATDAQTTWITGTNDCGLFENYGVNLDSETGVLIGTASS